MKSYIVPIVTILCTAAMGVTLTQNVTLNNFNAGELSPLMNSRVDFPKYRAGAKTLQNMLVRTQGPITRRPGTKYIAAVKDATDDTRIIPFSDSSDYIVEIGDDYARFFKSGAAVSDVNGADHYEVDTPWDANDVFELQYATAEGVMRIAHGDYEPYKLYRPDDTNDANWVCEAIGSETGPFLDENTDKDWTLTADANTGDVNIVSTDDLFDSDHVGALFQISHVIPGEGIAEEFTVNNYPSGTEESEDIIKVRKYQYYDVITNSDWYGTFKIQRSYDDAVTWEDVYVSTIKYFNAIQYAGREMEETCVYRMQMVGLYRTSHNYDHYEKTCHATFNTRPMTYNGVVEITTVTDATNAVATVVTELASTDATWRWAEGAWSDYRGWPRTIEYHEQRIIYGGSKSYPETMWASIIASKDSEYDEFTANTESDIEGNLGGPDDIAWTYKYPGMGEIQWIKAGKYLLIGTDRGCAAVGQPGRPMTPNYPPIMRIQNYNAAAFLQPAEASNAILYVEKGLEKVRELEYTYSSDKYEAPDLTILAEHITAGGIVDLAFQSRPDPILWCVRSDGVLLSFTYQRNNEAWSQHNTGTSDDFVSVANIPGSDEDELWALVDRTVDSNSVKYIEQFQPIQWDKVSSPYDQNDCYYVDCGTDAWDTIDHLESETVYTYADGRPLGSYTVSSGEISPTGSYTNKLAGLAYTSIYESMPIVLLGRDGPVMAEITDIKDFRIKFFRSLGAHVGYNSSNLTDLKFSSDSFATTLDVVTDYKVGPFAWGLRRAPTIYFSEADPIPMTIESIHLGAEVGYD